MRELVCCWLVVTDAVYLHAIITNDNNNEANLKQHDT
jgi:hypothetical protein